MKRTKNKLFLTDGCLTNYALERFLAGNLNKKQLQLVEQHIAICELCRDAVEGYQKEYIGTFPADLNERISSWVTEKAGLNKTKPGVSRSIIPYISLAASALFLIGLFFLYKEMTRIPSKLITEKQEDQLQPLPKRQDKELQLLLEEETIPEKKNEITKKKNLPPPVATRKIIENDNKKSDADNSEIRNTTVSPKEPVSVIESGSQNSRAQVKELLNVEDSEKGGKLMTTVKTEQNAESVPQMAKSVKENQPEKMKQLSDEGLISYESKFNEETANDQVFMRVENLPEFEGGNLDKFVRYVQQHLSYPSEATESGIEGKVFTSFVVDTTGKVIDVKIIRGVDSLLDNEAIRVISQSPLWTPGRQRGKPVKVQFTVPVVFKLEKK